jgi:hypothetical protein
MNAVLSGPKFLYSAVMAQQLRPSRLGDLFGGRHMLRNQIFLVGLLVFWRPIVSWGQDARQAALAEMVHSILISKMPTEHEERKNWGHYVRIFDGYDVKGKGLKIQLKKRERNANHGLWKRFKVWVDDPHRDLQIEIRNMRRNGEDKLQFELVGTVSAHGFAELKQWSNGVQLLGVAAEADAVVELNLGCEIALSAEQGVFLPNLVVEPRIIDSKLWLKDFRLRRVGPLVRGKVAKELGDEFRDEIQKQLHKNEHKVAEEANRAIAKSLQDGKLRLSPSELLQLSRK